MPSGDLRAAQLLWATVDSPWIHSANTDRYFETVRSLRDIDPDVVLSTHLPPATGIDDQLFDMLAEAPERRPVRRPGSAGARDDAGRLRTATRARVIAKHVESRV